MKKRALGISLYLLAVILLIGIVYYVTLPPISIYSGEFWTFFFFIDIVILVSYYIIGIISGRIFAELIQDPSGNIHINTGKNVKMALFTKIILILTAAVILFLIVGSVLSSQMFRAKTYSSLISVEDANFASDIAETEYVSDIALMDTASARIIGARTLGTLSDLVSQYNVSDSYT